MSSYTNMDENDGAAERYATCCTGPCRTNIQKAAFVIALLGFGLNMIQAVAFFMPDSSTHHHSIVFGTFYLLAALIYLSVIVAQRERNHLLFLPYLILVGMGLVAQVVLLGSMLYLVLTKAQEVVDEWNKEHPEQQMTVEQFRLIMLSAITARGFALALNGWFYSIIYRAYKHMKHVIGGDQVPPPV